MITLTVLGDDSSSGGDRNGTTLAYITSIVMMPSFALNEYSNIATKLVPTRGNI